jgi:hypothetical protein
MTESTSLSPGLPHLEKERNNKIYSEHQYIIDDICKPTGGKNYSKMYRKEIKVGLVKSKGEREKNQMWIHIDIKGGHQISKVNIKKLKVEI